MDYIVRTIEPQLQRALKRGKSILLLGARQTGKTTLISKLSTDRTISFINPAIRQAYERHPSLLIQELQALQSDLKRIPLVVIDEVQKIPEVMDVVQDLIDRKTAQFILTGSSARKLRLGTKVNLLPGRIVVLRLDPLMLAEIKTKKLNLEELLLFGALPVIFTVDNREDKEVDLGSYVTTYLEEEIRAEAVVRNIGSFNRFLILAAAESGNIVNFNKLSQEIGVAHTTITEYYKILEDCLIAERIDPLTKSKTRRKLIKSSKYLFFDLGVRRVAAEEGTKLPKEYLGKLFEQWVGLELIRRIRTLDRTWKIHFWRDSDGPEVDWVIVKGSDYFIPIEVKWSETPTLNDVRHLKLFQEEYHCSENAYIVCRAQRKLKLADNIYALPWQELDKIISNDP